ncbi:MAG: hypothetical protein IPG64_26070 [Haliea sp.]|nr:hypothetical protein [Haliea sp.]
MKKIESLQTQPDVILDDKDMHMLKDIAPKIEEALSQCGRETDEPGKSGEARLSCYPSQDGGIPRKACFRQSPRRKAGKS